MLTTKLEQASQHCSSLLFKQINNRIKFTTVIKVIKQSFIHSFIHGCENVSPRLFEESFWELAKFDKQHFFVFGAFYGSRMRRCFLSPFFVMSSGAVWMNLNEFYAEVKTVNGRNWLFTFGSEEAAAKRNEKHLKKSAIEPTWWFSISGWIPSDLQGRKGQINLNIDEWMTFNLSTSAKGTFRSSLMQTTLEYLHFPSFFNSKHFSWIKWRDINCFAYTSKEHLQFQMIQMKVNDIIANESVSRNETINLQKGSKKNIKENYLLFKTLH